MLGPLANGIEAQPRLYHVEYYTYELCAKSVTDLFPHSQCRPLLFRYEALVNRTPRTPTYFRNICKAYCDDFTKDIRKVMSTFPNQKTPNVEDPYCQITSAISRQTAHTTVTHIRHIYWMIWPVEKYHAVTTEHEIHHTVTTLIEHIGSTCQEIQQDCSALYIPKTNSTFGESSRIYSLIVPTIIIFIELYIIKKRTGNAPFLG